MVDLDELDSLHASLKPGQIEAVIVGQAREVVTLLRAYPALAAEVRALREVAAAARDLVDELPSHAYECPQRAESDHVPVRCRCHAAGRNELRAALAKVPR